MKTILTISIVLLTSCSFLKETKKVIVTGNCEAMSELYTEKALIIRTVHAEKKFLCAKRFYYDAESFMDWHINQYQLWSWEYLADAGDTVYIRDIQKGKYHLKITRK